MPIPYHQEKSMPAKLVTGHIQHAVRNKRKGIESAQAHRNCSRLAIPAKLLKRSRFEVLEVSSTVVRFRLPISHQFL